MSVVHARKSITVDISWTNTLNLLTVDRLVILRSQTQRYISNEIHSLFLF